jgi:DNA-binding response OmpR family regulator
LENLTPISPISLKQDYVLKNKGTRILYINQTKYSAKARKIFVVDDEYDVVYIVKRILEEIGPFQVDAYTDPSVALSYFGPDNYDLAILDIRMPDINGLELYKKIKAVDQKVKTCFLSAVHDLSEYKLAYPAIVDAIERDDECFIDKPIGSKKLINRINKIFS